MNTTQPESSTPAAFTYPFGLPVRSAPMPIAANHDVLVVGSAPSALYMRWRVPGGTLVQGCPVDDEPTPFWNGHDHEARLRHWGSVACWQDAWGAAGPSHQNGQTGRWLDETVLAPLGIGRERMVGATLLDRFHANDAVRRRIDGIYRPLIPRLGLPVCALPAMPGGDELVAAGLGPQRARLLALLEGPGVTTLITLGTPAFRVCCQLLGPAAAGVGPALLGDGPDYGQPQQIAWMGRSLRWFAFVSPSAPGSMLKVHLAWTQRQGGRAQVMLGAFK